MTFRDQLDACDASIRSHLDPDEEVLAVGTCNDITERGSMESIGLLAYVVVTDRKLRWVPDADVRFETSLAFVDVTTAWEARLGTGTR